MTLRPALLPLLALALPLAARAQVPAPDSGPRVDMSTCAKPAWPQASLRNEETGVVTLNFRIEEDGSVGEAAIAKSTGFPLLDMAAQDALARCKFVAATRDGRPVHAWMQMQYVWKLDEAARTTPEQWRAAQAGAESGDAESQYRLAMLYTGRDKQTRNLPEASRLLKQAAAQDHVNAQFALATMLQSGAAEPADVAAAAAMRRKAAEQGHTGAQYAMGIGALERGSADEAISWFRKAAAQGHMGSVSLLGASLIQEGRSANDLKEGLALLQRGVEANDMHAQYALGRCYDMGHGVAPDKERAAALYKKAVMGGHRSAQLALSAMNAVPDKPSNKQ